MKNKVFVVMVEYQDFEDKDNNYSEVRIVTKDWNIAVNKIIHCCEEEIEMDMVTEAYEISHNPEEFHEHIKDLITKFGYIAFDQQVGNGKSRIILEEMEMI